LASEFARKSIIARVSAAESGSPTPAAWERTHARCNGIGKFVAGDDIVNDLARPVHRLARFGQQHHGTAFNCDFPDRFQSQIITVDVECVQESLRCEIES
jgi:hypothetical protein